MDDTLIKGPMHLSKSSLHCLDALFGQQRLYLSYIMKYWKYGQVICYTLLWPSACWALFTIGADLQPMWLWLRLCSQCERSHPFIFKFFVYNGRLWSSGLHRLWCGWCSVVRSFVGCWISSWSCGVCSLAVCTYGLPQLCCGVWLYADLSMAASAVVVSAALEWKELCWW